MNDIMTWLAAVPTLIGFGLALGLNPALYGTTLDTLARGQNVTARLVWMLTGLIVGATLLFFILHAFNPTSLVQKVQGTVETGVVDQRVDLIAGIIFLLAGATLGLWAKRVPERPAKPATEPKQNSRPISLFVIGISSSVIGFTTLPIMYLTGRLVSSVSHNLLLRGFAYVVFLVALVAPFVLLALIWSRFPNLTKRVTEFYTRMLKWDYRWFACAILLLAGVALLVFVLLRL